MKEIKFRGKRVDNGEWVYGDLINSFEGTHISESEYFKPSNEESPTLTDIAASTVGQFTGIKDKNGKEIYEGDINQHGGVIIWSVDEASFLWEYKKVDENHSMEAEDKWCEIIGNVHDNPELLN